MAWRNARSLDVLRDEVNRRWPRRDTASDGTIGNADHQTRKSDHNKNAAGHVRARDIDDDLRGGESDPFWLAEHIRLLGKAGFGPLQNGGYVIYFARIAGSHTGWEWRDYTGPNVHKTHIHVSVSRDANRYDAETAWGIADIPTTDQPKPRPPKEEEDMKILHVVDGPEKDSEWLQRGKQLLFLDPTRAQQARNAGAPVGDVQEPLWSELKENSEVVAP